MRGIKTGERSVVQAIILFTGALAIWFSQIGNDALEPWACIVGLIGQPFFLYCTYRSRQWGMFLLSVLYTGAYFAGLWHFWLGPVATAWVRA